jgi:hypothetical protein
VATHAEEIKAGKRKPTPAVQDAIDSVTETAESHANGIKNALASGELRIRAYEEVVKAKAADGDEKAAELLASDRPTPLDLKEASGMSKDEAAERAQAVHDDWLDGSTYAYQFLDLEDGSRIVVYKTSADSKVEFEAFPDGKEPAGWHPRKAQEVLVAGQAPGRHA